MLYPKHVTNRQLGKTMSSLDEKIACATNVFARAAATWEGSESMPPAPWMPEGLEAVGRTEGRNILDGRGVASDYWQKANGKITLVAHTVFVLDTETGRVHMYFFSQGPTPMELIGEAEGHTLTVEGQGPGGPMRQSFDYGETEMEVISASQGPDGEWKELFRGTYRRV